MDRKMGNWYVKYRIGQGSWKSLDADNRRFWYADPMLFVHEDRTYLFTEAFDRVWQKGKLAVSVLREDGEFSTPKVVMNLPYHLSYPCVFSAQGGIYMIPETSQNRTLELWECVSGDMGRWVRKKILLRGVKYSDSTVLCCGEDDNCYIFCYLEDGGRYETDVYRLNLERFSVEKSFTVHHKENGFRPAGNFFYSKEGKTFRPLQYNVETYGEYIRIYEMDSFRPFSEHLVREVRISDLTGIAWEGACRTHTLGCEGQVTVVDFLVEKDAPIQKAFFLIRRMRNLYYKIKNGERIRK